MNSHEYWRRGDPRALIYKHREIIILRPSTSGYGWTAGTASVETKHTYSILTSFEDYPLIDDWNEDWAWCFAPELSFKEAKE
jgi:hypothetical protein